MMALHPLDAYHAGAFAQRLQYAIAHSGSRPGTRGDDLLDLLRHGPLRSREIAGQLGERRPVVSTRLTRLRAAGRAVLRADGRWCVAEGVELAHATADVQR